MLSRVEILSLAASPSSMSAPKNWVSLNFLRIAFLGARIRQSMQYFSWTFKACFANWDWICFNTISDQSFWCQEKLAKTLPSVVVRSKSRNLGARGDSLPNRLPGWVLKLFSPEMSGDSLCFFRQRSWNIFNLPISRKPQFCICKVKWIACGEKSFVFWECAFLCDCDQKCL